MLPVHVPRGSGSGGGTSGPDHHVQHRLLLADRLDHPPVSQADQVPRGRTTRVGVRQTVHLDRHHLGPGLCRLLHRGGCTVV